MQLPLLTAALVGAASVYAGCYNHGTSWDNEAEIAAASAADQFAGTQPPAGTPGPEQIIDVPTPGYTARFLVQNLSGHTWTLDRDYVYDYLMREVNGCEHGEDSSYTDWRFLADPNPNED